MWSAQLSCLGAVALWSRGGTLPMTLPDLWGTFIVLFVAQCVAGLVRIGSGTGPWRLLFQKDATGGRATRI